MNCGICHKEIESDYPPVGIDVTCPHCNATGFGTYDMNGEYMIEWYEDEE